MEKKIGAIEHPRYTDFRVLTISVIMRLQCMWVNKVHIRVNKVHVKVNKVTLCKQSTYWGG